ncbi:MAG: hypothetical protein QMB59_02990 [Bacteroidales bacterium]|jgi:hypothetical protein
MKAKTARIAAIVSALLVLGGCGAVSGRHSAPSTSPADSIASGLVPIGAKEAGEFNDNVLIIFYDSTVGDAVLLDEVKRYGSEVIYEYGSFNAIAISLPKDKGGPHIDDAITHFGKVKGVLSIERDRIYHLD